ncbi:bifunctional (p)ppGpp synthetase/guanosine-3',5'-bis(diphosphate) 3'-pyrophosphohydrolase [Caproiciproducens galactitolivorans]|uniref:GTP diphosphokinase n=1 Tax=Caproiciproducens galactitolivorans TaxID=642589 RepID=A0A4Z0Y2Y1_9FIRM|nr:bifunctional (p)ppGpp synthetase/guanosine-3',5'-bis(diphosphate) 3'-pyrophosphohydrolase [Caproiciproducens galactitolivorans]QEY34163.1 bifunctional (p)ppGpp synthetase/guanosine-3',5'-bis(diphosphate) 3'-pyrophosphohydrolase [Caproiciproducens galactitolivorans]TGJ78084.1 GTP pyrophosphokinase [Caproiciproducens galactitolivorans]
MAWPLKTYDDLIALINESEHDYDMSVIDRAYQLALTSHQDQKRLSGAPYISHPVAVACILVELGMDTESLAAGLLHDVVEDTPVNLEQIRKSFGSEIANLIDGVTKLGRIPYSSREEQQAENLRKMLIAMADDIRVIIIKLADRLHNMRTIEFMPPQKQRDKALENMEVYAPIAHRLGIRAVKEELEDLSLRCLDPIAYEEIESGLALRQNERKEFIELTKKNIYERVSPLIPNVYLEGRVKSINGIFRKTFIQGRSMEEIYDIYAVRVIVDTVNDCYNVLGIIHDMYRPIPNRFKDYISTPKPNLYQSLHTTVIGKDGIPFEVQIRTWEMHHTAEYGIAAHWKYKLGIGSKSGDSLEQRLAWIRQMLENQKDNEDATDLVRTIKSDLVPEEVFVFTPRGDVISLPSGSTVIDFAYAIHSAVGNRMVGAKVDKRIVPIDYKVKTGQIIEILTSKETHGPSRDWLKIVKTSEARNKIRAWFKREKREENIIEGKAELERELRRNGIELNEAELTALLEKIGAKRNCTSADDVYSAIGYGGIQLWKIMPKIKEDYMKEKRPAPSSPAQAPAKQPPKKPSSGVIVDGMDNCLIKFSRCCNPLPGDEIIGFITRGFGVSIHKRTCSNVPQNLSEAAEPERWIKAHWAGKVKEEFKSTLEIVALDRSGLLADVTQQLFNMHIFIHSLNSRETKDGNAVISATITINGLEHLNSIISRLSNIQGIISIKRS